MSWIERSVEQRLRQAVDAGELETPELAGKPLDLDSTRPQGWWADQFARRELSHDRRRAAREAVATAQAEFWRTATLGELEQRVAAANHAIDTANLNLVDDDQIERFDLDDIKARWRAVRRSS